MKLLDLLIGKPLSNDEEEGHKVTAWEGVPLLGLDALGSAAYGPEAALTILIPLGFLGLRYVIPISGIILCLLVVLYFSYRQTIGAYPNGGGSYTVARENLGVKFGLLAAAALSLDYLLNVAVGIAAGVGALVSAVPALHARILPLCLGILAVITVVNLRGNRESGLAWAFPTYVFVLSLFGVLAVGIARVVAAHGHPHALTPPPALPAASASTSLYLLLRAFASGCTAMTGVEAVSNGVTAFANPAVKRAEKTLTAIVGILGILLGGIAILSHAYHIGAMDQEKQGYQSVISQLVAAVVGRGAVYYVTIGSVLAVLCLSANTSFADFPRLCRLLAEDDFLPNSFANRGRRLVFTTGIVILAILSAGVLIAFGGITDRLIPLFAIGAFLAFTLSQAGMVMHWRRQLRGDTASPQSDTGAQLPTPSQSQASDGGPKKRAVDPGQARSSMAINAVGCISTGGAFCVMLVAKFTEGAWITLLLIPLLLSLFFAVKRHYTRIADAIRCSGAIDTSPTQQPPLIVVPIHGWNRVTEQAVRFALTVSKDIVAVHIATSPDEEKQTRDEWLRQVEEPLKSSGLATPRLDVIRSPYRRIFEPFLRHIKRLQVDHPNRTIGVVIPEVVETHWWYYLLHTQRATAFKAALLFGPNERIVIITVPRRLR